MRIGKFVFIIVLLLCIFETARLWFLSPARMASHFDIQGNPNAYASRLQFFSFQVQTALVVIGLALVMQILVLVVPVNLMNLPSREYWIAPEHRDGLRERMSGFAFWLFAAILLVVQVGFELSVQANLHTPVHFSAAIMLPAIAGFMVFSILMLFALGRSLMLPPEE